MNFVCEICKSNIDEGDFMLPEFGCIYLDGSYICTACQISSKEDL